MKKTTTHGRTGRGDRAMPTVGSFLHEMLLALQHAQELIFQPEFIRFVHCLFLSKFCRAVFVCPPRHRPMRNRLWGIFLPTRVWKRDSSWTKCEKRNASKNLLPVRDISFFSVTTHWEWLEDVCDLWLLVDSKTGWPCRIRVLFVSDGPFMVIKINSWFGTNYKDRRFLKFRAWSFLDWPSWQRVRQKVHFWKIQISANNYHFWKKFYDHIHKLTVKATN